MKSLSEPMTEYFELFPDLWNYAVEDTVDYLSAAVRDAITVCGEVYSGH